MSETGRTYQPSVKQSRGEWDGGRLVAMGKWFYKTKKEMSLGTMTEGNTNRTTNLWLCQQLWGEKVGMRWGNGSANNSNNKRHDPMYLLHRQWWFGLKVDISKKARNIFRLFHGFLLDIFLSCFACSTCYTGFLFPSSRFHPNDLATDFVCHSFIYRRWLCTCLRRMGFGLFSLASKAISIDHNVKFDFESVFLQRYIAFATFKLPPILE